MTVPIMKGDLWSGFELTRQAYARYREQGGADLPPFDDLPATQRGVLFAVGCLVLSHAIGEQKLAPLNKRGMPE